MQLHMVAPLFMWALNRDRYGSFGGLRQFALGQIPDFPDSRRSAILIVLTTIAVSTFLRAAYCLSYDTCNKSDVDIPVRLLACAQKVL